jgi:hypothetical protein
MTTPETDLDEIKRINASFVIFSAEPNAPEKVMAFFVENKVPFKVLLGSYDGVHETSYCIPHQHFDSVIQAGLVEEQDSILVLAHFNSDGLRAAEVVYLDERKPEAVGFFVNVDRDDALRSTSWTFDPMNDKFFVIRTSAELVKAGLIEA